MSKGQFWSHWDFFFFSVFLQEFRKVGWLTEPDVFSIIAINAVLALMCLLMVLVLSHCTANSKSSKITSFSTLLFLWEKTGFGETMKFYFLSLWTLSHDAVCRSLNRWIKVWLINPKAGRYSYLLIHCEISLFSSFGEFTNMSPLLWACQWHISCTHLGNSHL